MDISLTPIESEDYFLDALCNGLHELSNYGIELDFSDNEFKLSRASLEIKSPCFEDILMQMLRDGYILDFIDTESEETTPVTIYDVHARVQTTDTRHLFNMINGQGDAITSAVILQTVIYGDVIFG